MNEPKKSIELNIEIPDDLKRQLKSEAALNGVALKEMAGWILVEFFKLTSEEKAARLAQWKSTTLTREYSSPKTKEGNPKRPFYSPSQAPFLPPSVADSIMHGIKVVAGGTNPATELPHGVTIGESTGKMSLLPAVVMASERSL